jgi:hypothetical protein
MPALLTVIDVVSQAAMEIGIAQQRVSSVVSTADQDIAQMRSLLTSVADEVMSEEPYQHSLGDQNWLQSSTGEPLQAITSDSDVVQFDGRLAVQGLKWRFLQAKGLEFGESLRDFTSRMNKLAARANARVLDLDIDGSRWI